MIERLGAITFKGQPLTLIGPELKIEDTAPDFKVVDENLQDVKFSSLDSPIKLISVVPSLDTPVCDAQTRRFNEEASSFSEDVGVLTISMDLPFAQIRFCTVAGIDRITVLSDYKYASFGKSFGILIKELHLLGRGVFIVDAEKKIRYVEYVREMTHHPHYEAALAALKSILLRV